MPRRLLTGAMVAAAAVVLTATTAGAAGMSVAPVGHTAADSRVRAGTGGGGLAARLARYLSHRDGRAAVAVLDLRTGRRFGYHASRHELTASIVKVEILEALLRRRASLSPADQAAARGMIERSDNADAQRLWHEVGEARGLRRFGQRAGLTATDPAGGHGPGYRWGLTLTTPRDQVRLLALLAHRNPLLPPAQRRYLLRLMRHVTPDQRWGVSAGAGTARVAVKNGWLPLRAGSRDWQIDSIGFVTGRRGRGYLIAAMTTGNPSMGYGVTTAEGVSRRVARRELGRPTTTITIR